ncbi:hypothetical protein AMTRI_Chr13g86690 [Amborella trichopoda]
MEQQCLALSPAPLLHQIHISQSQKACASTSGMVSLCSISLLGTGPLSLSLFSVRALALSLSRLGHWASRSLSLTALDLPLSALVLFLYRLGHWPSLSLWFSLSLY